MPGLGFSLGCEQLSWRCPRTHGQAGLCLEGHESLIFGGVGAGDLSCLTWTQCQVLSGTGRTWFPPLLPHQGARWALASTSTAGNTAGMVLKDPSCPMPIPALAHPSSLNLLCSQAEVKGEPPGASA